MTGESELYVLFASWVAGWAAAFYGLALSASRWGRFLPPSSKPHEDCRFWLARNVLGVAHACLVGTLALPAVFVLVGAGDDVRFGSSVQLATCQVGPDLVAAGEAWMDPFARAIAIAGLAFTSFTAVDLVLLVVHGPLTLDYVVHHLAFIGAGLVIRGHCVLPLNSAILLSMEVSTPFLNLMLLLRNRGPTCYKFAAALGSMFAVLFVAVRLLLNAYGAALLLTMRAEAMPARVPAWQQQFLLGAVAAGVGVQFFWLPQIARALLAAIRPNKAAARQEHTSRPDAGATARNHPGESCGRLLDGVPASGGAHGSDLRAKLLP